jgi:hypothetical protein
LVTPALVEALTTVERVALVRVAGVEFVDAGAAFQVVLIEGEPIGLSAFQQE